jgi:type III secretory pathway component EscS
MMPAYPGFIQFDKPYSQVTHCSGKESKPLGYIIVPVFVATHVNPLASPIFPFAEALLCVNIIIVYIDLMLQHHYHTKAIIEYIKKYLQTIHHHKDVVS